MIKKINLNKEKFKNFSFNTEKLKSFNFNENKYAYILFSLVIAYILISPEDITWAKDRINYLTYAESSDIIIDRYLGTGLLSLLSNEPIFLLINTVLAWFFSPETIIKIIIFISTFFALYSLGYLSNYNPWILLLFIGSPTVLLKYITHLRQGLAMSVYFLGLIGYSRNSKWKNIRFIAPFIHTSMLFVVFFEILIQFFQKYKLERKKRLYLSFFIMFVAVFSIPIVANILGDRRINEYTFNLNLAGSGIGLLFWIFIGGFFIKYRDTNYISEICDYGIMFYIISYFYLPFGSRVLESIFPLIILSAVTDNKKIFRSIYTYILIIYGLMNWYVRGGIIF